jgi:hypothetical protein
VIKMRTELAGAGVIKDEVETVRHIYTGLPPEYNLLMLAAAKSLPSLADVQRELLTATAMLNDLGRRPGSSISSGLLVNADGASTSAPPNINRDGKFQWLLPLPAVRQEGPQGGRLPAQEEDAGRGQAQRRGDAAPHSRKTPPLTAGLNSTRGPSTLWPLLLARDRPNRSAAPLFLLAGVARSRARHVRLVYEAWGA